MKNKTATIYITGDRNLIDEFLSSPDTKRYRVIGTMHGATAKSALPRGMKWSATIPRTTRVAIELSRSRERKEKNIRALDRLLHPSAIILSSSVLVTVSEQAGWMRHAQRLVGISAFPTLLSRPMIEVAATIRTDAASLLGAKKFLKDIGKELSVVQDRVGMVMPRILCMIINEAAFALTEQVASPADIDAAMKLGTNYPEGPVAWGDRIGFETVEQLLLALRDDLGEERYRPAPLLRQLAMGHGWWNLK